MDLMVLMGIVLDLMETIMVSILVCDGMLNPVFEKCPKHTTKMNCVMDLQEKVNGLL